MTDQEKQKLADDIAVGIKDALAEVRKAKVNLLDFKAVASLVKDVVGRVENLSRKFCAAGPEKRDIAVRVLSSLIKSPLPEWLERWVIGQLIDWAVDQLNRRYGKLWPGHVTG